MVQAACKAWQCAEALLHVAELLALHHTAGQQQCSTLALLLEIRSLLVSALLMSLCRYITAFCTGTAFC